EWCRLHSCCYYNILMLPLQHVLGERPKSSTKEPSYSAARFLGSLDRRTKRLLTSIQGHLIAFRPWLAPFLRVRSWRLSVWSFFVRPVASGAKVAILIARGLGKVSSTLPTCGTLARTPNSLKTWRSAMQTFIMACEPPTMYPVRTTTPRETGAWLRCS